jgi:outer membrane protein assembly factor BamB
LPERCNSTPVVWGDRIFLTQPIEKEGRGELRCFDRSSGKLRWQSSVAFPGKATTHATNPYCSSSPTTDGERVIVSFASAGLYCYDLEGKELWHRDLGTQSHIWGNAASPVIHGNLCFFNFGPGETTFLIALDKKTGKTVWQNNEPGGNSGADDPGGKHEWVGSWTTPTFITEAGHESLIMTWPRHVVSLDPKSGSEYWTCQGLNPLVYTSPLYSDGTVVAMGGFGGITITIKTGGNGDVTATHKLWTHPKTSQRVGSGVIHEGCVYIVNDPGIAECFELKTGKRLWQERLTGPGKNIVNWSSLVLSDGNLYTINKSGDTFVLKASPKFEVISTNSLSDYTASSIVAAQGDLYIRTTGALWCISDKAGAK